MFETNRSCDLGARHCTGQLGEVGKAAVRLLDIWRMSQKQNPGENGARLGVCCDDPGQGLKHFISPWKYMYVD
jgi:hypothetical protein